MLYIKNRTPYQFFRSIISNFSRVIRPNTFYATSFAAHVFLYSIIPKLEKTCFNGSIRNEGKENSRLLTCHNDLGPKSCLRRMIVHLTCKLNHMILLVYRRFSSEEWDRDQTAYIINNPSYPDLPTMTLMPFSLNSSCVLLTPTKSKLWKWIINITECLKKL